MKLTPEQVAALPPRTAQLPWARGYPVPSVPVVNYGPLFEKAQ